MQYPKISSVSIKNSPSIENLSITSQNYKSDKTLKLLNTLTTFVGYPQITKQLFLESIISTINLIEKDCLIKNEINTEILLSKKSLIDSYKDLEQECDLLEINLANLKVRYDDLKEYFKYDENELKKTYTSLNLNFNDIQFEMKHKSFLDQIFFFLKGEQVTKNILDAFFYIKKQSTYKLILEKEFLLKKIRSTSNKVLREVFTLIVSHGKVSIKELEYEYNLDRSDILKIVCTLVNKDIIEYDKKSDIIIFNK